MFYLSSFTSFNSGDARPDPGAADRQQDTVPASRYSRPMPTPQADSLLSPCVLVVKTPVASRERVAERLGSTGRRLTGQVENAAREQERTLATLQEALARLGVTPAMVSVDAIDARARRALAAARLVISVGGDGTLLTASHWITGAALLGVEERMLAICDRPALSGRPSTPAPPASRSISSGTAAARRRGGQPPLPRASRSVRTRPRARRPAPHRGVPRRLASRSAGSSQRPARWRRPFDGCSPASRVSRFAPHTGKTRHATYAAVATRSSRALPAGPRGRTPAARCSGSGRRPSARGGAGEEAGQGVQRAAVEPVHRLLDVEHRPELPAVRAENARRRRARRPRTCGPPRPPRSSRPPPCRSRARCGCPRRSAAGSGRRGRRRRTRRPRSPGACGGGSSCPGSRSARACDVLDQPHRRLLDVVVRVERADADAHLVAAPGTTSRSRRRRSAGRSTARGRRRRPPGAPPARARARASGGWTFRPAPSTRRQPSASTISGAAHVAAVGVHRPRPVRPSTFAVSNSASPACSHSSAHSCAVVERRERPTAAASAPLDRRGVCTTQRVERLPDRAPPDPGCAATRSARRTPRSGARRSRSGRAPARARRVARSSRATARPANEAPQIRTSVDRRPCEAESRCGAALRGSYRHG